MKIVLVNYRYFISGGAERYLFNIKQLLEEEGHEVIPFSVEHKLNLSSEYDKYFVSPIGKGDVTYFGEYDKTNILEVFKTFSRMFYSFEARKKFRKLILQVNPDIVYVLQYQNKLSPSFLDVAKRFHLPVVQRISDFGNICANQVFYNYKLNAVCEACLNGSKLNAVKYRCVYNSCLYSLIKVSALKMHEVRGVTKKIDAFVVPSKFTISKLSKYGIAESKLIHLPSFYKAASEDCNNLNIKYGDFALYIGRLEKEKGIMTMVKAFENTGMKLKIIGFSANIFDIEVKEYLAGKNHNIEFLGKLSFDLVKKYLNECAFTICPSECYDNFPNSVIESFAFQKAVICTDLGSLKEMVINDVTGLVYSPLNHMQLREHCSNLFSNLDESIRLGMGGRKLIETELSERTHYNALISVFRKLALNKNN